MNGTETSIGISQAAYAQDSSFARSLRMASYNCMNGSHVTQNARESHGCMKN